MRQLFIVRHAKSDQSFFGNDFERPLNERGKKDAPQMAKRLGEKKITPDALISSPAARAKATAEFFAKGLQIDKEKIIFISALYHAPAQTFYEEIAKFPDDLNSVAIFSHNAGITNFVNSLNSGAQVDNMPTCAVFAVSVDIKNWSAFEQSKKEFMFFDYPKKV